MKTNLAGRINIEGGIYQGRGVGWPSGVDSFSHPLYINELQLRWGENMVVQGGFAQARYGYKSRLTFDINQGYANAWWQANFGPIVHPQMLERFQPNNGVEQLVFAISGSVFFSSVNNDGSLSAPTLIPGFQFNRLADQLTGTPCTQSASIIGGKYANNIQPRNLLIIQDGASRAGIWDGNVGVHANPEKRIMIASDDGTLYPEGWNQTRIGLWSAWSGNRLWIADGKNVYASDLNDPTHFTEELSLQSAPVFTFTEIVTGMIDRGTSGTTRSQVVVFTSNTTETLWSGIQNRLPSDLGQGWAFTPDFRTKIFDSVGCVAGKSVVVHRGLLYWKSRGGIVMFDSTQTVNSSQNLPPIDQEMAYSKIRVAPSAEGMDLTCSGKFGSYVWWSAPVGRVINGRRYCGHTQVLDRQTTTVRSLGTGGAFSAGTTGWQGVWTGILPVDWANVIIGGQERSYALSLDSSGTVRIWEAFQSNRADNGHPIPWFMETRVHPVQPSIFEYGTFRHFRLLMDQIGGKVDVVGMWRGLKGTYHEQLTTTINATPGSILLPLPQYTPITNTTVHESFSLQGRTVISRNLLGNQAECNARGVESSHSDASDHAFGLAIRVVGRAAISGYLIAVDSEPENSEGEGRNTNATGIDESGFNIVPNGGCPSRVSGTPPVFIAADQPIQIGQCPYQPSASLSFDYSAPTS
jgi:hypothetical protein